MKTFYGIAAALILCAALAAPAATIERVRISGTKKSGAPSRGPAQQTTVSTANVKQSESYYRFEIQRAALDVPENLVCEYMVVVQTANGHLYPGATKTEEFVLTAAQAAVIESEPVTLRALEWQNQGIMRGGGKVSEEVYGWIVRVKDEKGTLVGEKSQPKDLAVKWDALVEEGTKQERAKDFFNAMAGKKGENKNGPVVVAPHVVRPAGGGGGHGGGRR